MRRIQRSIASVVIILLMACDQAAANMVWPALYVLNSQARFYYIVALTVIVEAGILLWRFRIGVVKTILLRISSPRL